MTGWYGPSPDDCGCECSDGTSGCADTPVISVSGVSAPSGGEGNGGTGCADMNAVHILNPVNFNATNECYSGWEVTDGSDIWGGGIRANSAPECELSITLISYYYDSAAAYWGASWRSYSSIRLDVARPAAMTLASSFTNGTLSGAGPACSRLLTFTSGPDATQLCDLSGVSISLV